VLVITGASGMVGGPAIQNLIAAGQPIRALSSNAASASKLAALGVRETVIGNFRNAGDLRKLMDGAATVVHIPPSVVEDEDRIGFDVIAAARAARIEHFVFVSCFHSQISELRHHRNKLLVEDALIKSGLTYTILQPAMFMQNLGFIWSKIEQGLFEWPWDPARKYAMLDTEDLGEVIRVVSEQPRFRGGTYELCSPDTISVIDMAEQLSAALRKPLRTARGDADAWAVGMTAAGASAWSIQTVLGMCRFHDAHGYDGGNSLVLEMILGRHARTYRDFAARVAQRQGAALQREVPNH
jgi:uncharacterized protein YbjT (DUF2867 family)